MKYSDIPEEEKDNILSGLEEWSKEYSKRTPQNTSTVFDIPPVRGQKISEMQSQSGSNNGKQRTNEAKNKICKLRSYQEWDKFDIEEELEKLEGKDEIEKTENKTEEKISLNTSIAVPGLSAVEREHIANLERMKGNEAFKAQDYEEAVLYYTRSLSAFRTAKTLNNRAQTHLKLKNYLEAVIDCNEVINMEPNNIKALYRRGIAHKEAKMLDLAVIDFEIILRLEPESKSARASPFEFLQVWLSNSCNSNSTNGAACLLAVKPQELPKILTNKLDGPLLSSLFMAIKYLFNTGKLKESSEYLKFLLEVPRIKLTALFLSSDEKNDIQDLLISMENQLRENLNYARKVLSISREQ
ncbi:unnamed protein product [Larinioides sclopetarius]|uniref:RNA-polymerase II-associated protein 3-like C-terminal domain-containing protein n=2 Tax=Larinioides sclopetarius TaxID=280406 RepID=A0AAV2AXL8_9ARAC